MHIEHITYTDYDGNERTEDFYFNLNKAELIRWQASKDGGLEKYLQKIISTQNVKELMETFRSVILMAYGERSEDGKRFIKSKELSESFEQTEAYSELFMKLMTDTDAAAKFINSIIPKDLNQNTPNAIPVNN